MSTAGNGKAPNGAEEFANEVFDRAPTPTVLVRAGPDGAGRFFRANQAMCALVGGGPEYLLAQTLAGFFDGPDRAAAEAIDWLSRGAPAGCEFEARFHRADGAVRVAHVLGSPVSPGSGASSFVIVQMRDVTDQRAAHATQLQLATLVESSDDAIIGVTLTGTIQSWNRGAESLFGYTAGETVGRPIFMLVPNDRMHEVPAFLPHIPPDQRVEPKETLLIAKDGTALDVSWTISPVAGPGGEVTAMVVIARDITGQKRTEAELRRSSRYFELSRDMVCTAGLDGRFRQLNGTWTEVLGWTNEELRSRPFVDFVHPQDREATIRETSRLAEGAMTVGFVNRYATKAGGWRWFDWNARTAPDEELVYATARDVTDRMEAEATQAASEGQLRQIIEVAHDAFIAMNATGTITAWNPAAAATFGWTGLEALGRDLADTILPVRYREPH
ncbi:MAG: PAS domain S-box protein, partial [Acidimicrobiales bacterium]